MRITVKGRMIIPQGIGRRLGLLPGTGLTTDQILALTRGRRRHLTSEPDESARSSPRVVGRTPGARGPGARGCQRDPNVEESPRA
jgi:hypothetical protein